VSAVLASIPSPPTGVYHVGPLTIHMYGVMLLLAIASCIYLTGKRWVRWGGDWDLIFRVAIWGVIAGIVGARIYHDITSWNQDAAIHEHWYGPFAVWSGGLGIWGAIPFGVGVGAWIVRRSGNSVRLMMDAVAPGLLLAQGVEIHGKGAINEYHPTFLYEFIWDLLGVGVLLWIDRRYKLRRPALFSLYVAIYCAFRCYEETLRIDPSHHFLGQRLNFWVSLVCFIASVLFFIWWQFRRKPSADQPSKARPRAIPTGPKMAVPRGRVRQRG
jgi:phosphatidylglycerol---prolipoprotein diacylglyceryl transferase